MIWNDHPDNSDSVDWEPDETDADLLNDETDIGLPDDQVDQTIHFADHVESCPACGKPIRREMDSCPFCGDILFRTLRDGTFIPQHQFWRAVVVTLIVMIVVLASALFLWRVLTP